MERKYCLGLDLGIASVGWALFEMNNGNVSRLEDAGSYVFNKLEDKDGKMENVARRNQRSLRRQNRRKKLRLDDFRTLCRKKLDINISFVDNKWFVNGTSVDKIGNPYEIKLKGLKEKLSIEEFYVCLYHYLKYRGFKSSRKIQDKQTDGKLLDVINATGKILDDNNLTITEYLVNSYEKNQRIHNKSSNYIMAVDRSMYLKEIEMIFSTQIKNGLVDEEFKTEYLKIYNRQRNFAEGPGRGSKFGNVYDENGNIIETMIDKMIGKCKFDGNPRAPKEAFSAKSFVLLSFLHNISYRVPTSNSYLSLEPDEIAKIYNGSIDTKKISYNSIFKLIGIKDFAIKGLSATRKQYSKFIESFKAKNNIQGDLDENQREVFYKELRKEIQGKDLNLGFNLYIDLKKELKDLVKAKKLNGIIVDNFLDNRNNIDVVAEILLRNKTDERIYEACIKNGIPSEIAKVIENIDAKPKTIDLSLELCKSIIPWQLKGYSYSDAMKQLNYNHSKPISIGKAKFLPDIDTCISNLQTQLTNPNVKHTLVYMRQIINELIKKYGEISEYHIEMTRELKKSFEARRKIADEQNDERNNNSVIKEIILMKYPNYFHKLSDVKRDDVIKYKLFLEQKGRCAYSYEMICEANLFDNNLYQIDHILPYSRTYDDSYSNKVLVKAIENQNKKNLTPKEYYVGEKWENVQKYLNNSTISEDKREKILTTKIDDEFINRNISDTSYITTLACSIIKEHLQPEVVNAPSGRITSKLKKMWHISNLTHSYISDSLRNNEFYVIDQFSLNKENITLDLHSSKTNQKEQIVIKPKALDKAKTEYEKALSKSFEFFKDQGDFLLGVVSKFYNQNILTFFSDATNKEITNINSREYRDNLLPIISELGKKMSEIVDKKDRSNHLHHALDACVIAATTQSMIQKFSVSNRKFENQEYDVDPETGEVKSKLQIDMPYKEFANEVAYRIYERDLDKLKLELSMLKNYENVDLRGIHIVYPARHPAKYKAGALTKETIYGVRKDALENKTIITKKIPVEKINKKNIEDMLYKDKEHGGGNGAVYKAVLEWLDLPEKNRPQYPILPKKNTPIHSVKMLVTDKPETKVMLNEEKYAENDNVIRVDVYKKAGSEQLYFVPIYYLHLCKEKNKQTVVYNVMWGQGENREFITGAELKAKYSLVCQLPRYSLIEVTLKSGEKGLCYSAGLSSGKFEFYSILGDDIDLKHSNLITTISERNYFTVSQITNIKVKNISKLGKIS